jgi:predicted ATPase
VAGRVFLAWTLWLLGYPEQALQRSQEAITLAREVSHANSMVYALNFAAIVHSLRREWQATHALTKEACALCAEQGFPFWLALGNILHGWTLAEEGQTNEGIAQMRQGLAAYQATGAASWRTCFLSLLIEVNWKNHQDEEGLTVLAEAFALVEKNDERFWEAELYRLKGELILQSAEGIEQSATAEACFQQALEMARRQKAKSLELRAAMSLGRLWQQQNKKAAARQLLSESYNWFSEGFDTADLKEAKALLGQWL